jgi:hypothetical protein
VEGLFMKKDWLSQAKAEADKGIPHFDRAFSFFMFVFSILLIIYFANHQMQSTGFLTKSFGLLEIIFLYGYSVFWIISAGLEGVLGQRLLSRMVDAFGGVIFGGICIIWLFFVFPFDFTNFAVVLPDHIRFLLVWISNDIARVIMLLGIILHISGAIYCPIAYKFVDKTIFKGRKTK